MTAPLPDHPPPGHPGNTTIAKRSLRTLLRQRRRGFVAEALAAGGLPALTHALTGQALGWLAGARIVSGYLSDGDEVDSLPLLALATGARLVTALPHIGGDGTAMRFLRWSPGDSIEPGPHGLRQPLANATPVEPDLVLTPMLGFDAGLFRLGQGGGHYDRYFAAHPHARRLGLAWSVQSLAPDALPADPWDVALHGVATELSFLTGSLR